MGGCHVEGALRMPYPEHGELGVRRGNGQALGTFRGPVGRSPQWTLPSDPTMGAVITKHEWSSFIVVCSVINELMSRRMTLTCCKALDHQRKMKLLCCAIFYKN